MIFSILFVGCCVSQQAETFLWQSSTFNYHSTPETTKSQGATKRKARNGELEWSEWLAGNGETALLRNATMARRNGAWNGTRHGLYRWVRPCRVSSSQRASAARQSRHNGRSLGSTPRSLAPYRAPRRASAPHSVVSESARVRCSLRA